MAKHLYLFRHAESIDKQLHEADKDRELTSSGMKEAAQIGAYFGRENFPLNIIISSSANRAQATAQLASNAMRFDAKKILIDDELYNASVRTLFEFVTKLDDQYDSVMIVGHNPTISYLAEHLTKAVIGDMVTGGLVIIKFNISDWSEVKEGGGELINYIYPAMLQTL